ncbi:MAG: phage tail protein, partial [Anaerolineales bacterium]
MRSDSVAVLTKPTLLQPEISLAVDFYNRYPGEDVCYFVRFRASQDSGISLQLSFPKVLQVISYQIVGQTALPSLLFSETEQVLLVVLNIQPPLLAGQEYILEIRAQINTFQFDQHILADAILLNNEKEPIARDEIQVTVYGKSQYLRYLPEIYQMDDFTSRFLMLVESFWKPLSLQIDQASNYFDPNLVPPEFLPWLSSWVGLRLDINLPDDRVRMLLKKGVILFQSRGTLYALKTYLEIITGGNIQIREQRASNFTIGRGSALGVGIALGRKNRPNALV